MNQTFKLNNFTLAVPRWCNRYTIAAILCGFLLGSLAARYIFNTPRKTIALPLSQSIFLKAISDKS